MTVLDRQTLKKTVGVVGAGAFGTALAIAATRAGHHVILWLRNEDAAKTMQQARCNEKYLTGIDLPPAITVTADAMLLSSCDVILLCTPAQHMEVIVEGIKSAFQADAPLLICAKGIDIKTGRLLSQILQVQCPGHPVGILTGPSFAQEVANDLPTALTLAIAESYSVLAYELCRWLSTPHLRIYATHDMVGAQVGGALKNVIAIACGIAAGKDMGDNARAALITRGLAEIVRFGRALGADSDTFLGLSGLGDLTLTCNAMQSRNFSLGVAIGQGKTPQQILADRHSVAEGVYTAEAVVKLAQRLDVDMPICQAVHETLSGQKSIDYVIKGLLGRPVKSETH
jgi:glycerol-3-phosphate dehydrogenase (NAD(P)+)